MPTVYDDRPTGYVLREGTWLPCIVRMERPAVPRQRSSRRGETR